jgi:hypothetical protein
MKSINLVIKTCDECPFCTYDGDYGLSHDSGYDCKKVKRRIVDDWDCCNTNNKNPNPAPFKIPEWYPMEDAN